MKILALALSLLFFACVDPASALTDPATSTGQQDLCSAEDWGNGNCPDSAWRIDYTAAYAQTIAPSVVIEGAHCYNDDVTWCCLTGATIVFSCTWAGGAATCTYHL